MEDFISRDKGMLREVLCILLLGIQTRVVSEGSDGSVFSSASVFVS